MAVATVADTVYPVEFARFLREVLKTLQATVNSVADEVDRVRDCSLLKPRGLLARGLLQL